MWDPDELLHPELAALRERAGDLALFDVHTHIGGNDPDGYKQTPRELLDHLAPADARAVVFPMHEPDGYEAANDAVLATVAAADGRLAAFCRVDPKDPGAVAEARRCLDAGARGIKLHPRAERFGMEVPAVRDLAALAHERRAPILIHAGRGIPALGEHTLRYAADFPDARFILAHSAISDLAWMHRELPSHPNVLIDTAWWNVYDLLALFALVPAGQVVYASDSPYGSPVGAAVVCLRCALESGLDGDALRSVMGAQAERLLAGDDLLDAGPPAGMAPAVHPVLERIASHLIAGIARGFARADPTEPLALARLACDVEDDGEIGAVSRRVRVLLDEFDRHKDDDPRPGRPFGEAWTLLVVALATARTPRAGVAG